MPRYRLSRMVNALTILFMMVVLLSGCAPALAATQAAGTATPTEPAQQGGTVESTKDTRGQATATDPGTAAVAAAETAVAPVVWVSPRLPEGARKALTIPAGAQVTTERTQANLFVDFGEAGKSSDTGLWVYALAAPFPTAADGFALEDLLSGWREGTKRLYQGKPLLMSAETQTIFEGLWGPAKAGSVQVVADSDLLETAWKEQNALAVIPFEQIGPRWKVLRIDGISPLDKDFTTYPLAAHITAQGDAAAARAVGEIDLPTNRDPNKLTVLVMTGVTAISRQIAEQMESKGLTYPASEIHDWLAGADLTHISNEVSFSKDCPKANPQRRDMRFCSQPEYIQLLEYVGTDIVELTGNHNLDWGPQPYLDTLAMYRERGWKTFGGGATLKEAQAPLLIEDHGNRLAFLGCSPAGPQDVWATPASPGSAPCDFTKLEESIRELRQQGYLPVVTFQHVETDGYAPAVAQGKPDFRRMAAAGAAIVSGSQSHYAQTMTFVNDSFVHYGLGNLFFDQMKPEEIRAGFIDRHVFYDGRYLGVELLTSKLEDYALQRPMNAEERARFLETIFSLCNWHEE